MAIQASRQAIYRLFMDHHQQAANPRNGSHAGLILNKFLPKFDNNDLNKGEARIRLFQMAIDALNEALPLYQIAYARYLNALDHALIRFFEATGRMAIGLGATTVLETGVTLHYTYGTPYLPGSAIKGLASSYCSQVWGREDAHFGMDGKYYKTLFGTQASAGFLTFHDAWIDPDTLSNSLLLDVMTVHHPDYYSSKPENVVAPTDFDDPNPVSFLSIKGRFAVPISCEVQNEEGKRWTELAMELVTEALQEWGIGAKTYSGYGQMNPIDGSQKCD